MKTLARDFAALTWSVFALACIIALSSLVSGCATAPRTRIELSDGTRIETRGDMKEPATVTRDASGKLTITTPTTPPPPAPPTPSDFAAATILKWYNLAAIVLLIAAAVAAWRGYARAAICLGVAAFAAPLLGNFGQSTIALIITAAFVCAALAYVSAWYALRHKLTPSALPQ